MLQYYYLAVMDYHMMMMYLVNSHSLLEVELHKDKTDKLNYKDVDESVILLQLNYDDGDDDDDSLLYFLES
jgi:hypothetical protein